MSQKFAHIPNLMPDRFERGYPESRVMCPKSVAPEPFCPVILYILGSPVNCGIKFGIYTNVQVKTRFVGHIACLWAEYLNPSRSIQFLPDKSAWPRIADSFGRLAISSFGPKLEFGVCARSSLSRLDQTTPTLNTSLNLKSRSSVLVPELLYQCCI